MIHHLKPIWIALVVALVACEPPTRTIDPREADASSLVSGMRLIEAMNLEHQITPPRAARLSAYAAVAHHEALVPFIDGAVSLSSSMAGMPPVPPPPRGTLDPASVGVVAFAETAAALVRQDWLLFAGDVLPQLEVWREGELAARDLDEETLLQSRIYGVAVAEALLPWMLGDGFLDRRAPYALPVIDGGWRPTDPSQIAPLEPHWRGVRPLVVADLDACAPPPPPPWSADPGPFFAAAQEVHAIAQTRSEEQRQIGLFWNDNRRTTTPPGHWLAILHIVVLQEQLSLADASAVYTLASAAMHDAFVASWTAKYDHLLQRPISYIHDHIDADFAPLFLTPPHPSFTSGHAAISSAAAAVLNARLGAVAFVDDSRENDDTGVAARSFNTFDEAAAEAAISRVYAGIHYRFDAEGGTAQGGCVGARVAAVDVGY